MADELQASLQNYILQLQQVDAALSIDPDNEELNTLKKDLEEVLELTKDLIKQQLVEAAGGSQDEAAVSDVDLLKPRPQHNFNVGDACMAMSSDDGKYYEGVIEDISEDGEQVSVKFDVTGAIEVTVFAFLKPAKNQNAKKRAEDAKNRKQSESHREYQKKRKLKKQVRHKALEEEREQEKNKWLAFTTKKKGSTLLAKRSIFASPESVTGRVGIGTCGVSGLPMTEYSQAEKRKKGT